MSFVYYTAEPISQATYLKNLTLLFIVGNALDQACKIEAMLRSLSLKRKKLRMEQTRVDNQFIHLLNDLQISLQNDEDMTVICADTFSAVDGGGSERTEPYTQSRQSSFADSKASVAAARPVSPPEEQNENEVSPDIIKPLQMERQITPPRLQQQSTGSRLVCFASDVFDPSSPQEAGRMLLASMSQPFLQSLGSSDNNDNNSVISTNTATQNLFSTMSQPSPNEMRAGARAWRERNNRDPSSGIDFRTGMSGHMALLSSHAHPHEYLEQKAATIVSSRGRQLKMSSHMGLSRPKPKQAGIFGIRSLGFSTSREDETAVPRTGSM
jgi:hypothetical protein